MEHAGLFQKLPGIGELALGQDLPAKLCQTQHFQQGFLSVQKGIRLSIPGQGIQRRLKGLGQIRLPGSVHDSLIGRGGHLLLQEITHRLFQSGCQILQGRHRGPGFAAFDLGEHIAGDLLAAQLPLGQSCRQPGLPQLFTKVHRKLLSGNYHLPYYSTKKVNFHRHKKFICYFHPFAVNCRQYTQGVFLWNYMYPG